MLIENSSEGKKTWVLRQLRAPEHFSVSSLVETVRFQFISEQKKILKILPYTADTSEVLKYYRNSNSLSKLKVKK